MDDLHFEEYINNPDTNKHNEQYYPSEGSRSEVNSNLNNINIIDPFKIICFRNFKKKKTIYIEQIQ